MDKKKLIKILRIIAYISLATGGIIILSTEFNNVPSAIFLFDCIFPIMVFLGIPAFDMPFLRLKPFREPAIKPNALLRVYLVIACVYIVIMTIIPFSFTNAISDVPSLIGKNYSQINHAKIQTVEKHFGGKGPRELHLTAYDGTELRLFADAFVPINADEKYTFSYLPRTKWVMDIIDEDGNSLLIRQRK